jgi:hypothetical protein
VTALVAIGVGLVLVMKYFNHHQLFHDALAWIGLRSEKKFAPAFIGQRTHLMW